jgi:hypothetical protein
VFESPLGVAAETLFTDLDKKGEQPESLGRHIVHWAAGENGNARKSLYCVQAKPNVLLCATDRRYLSELLDKMTTDGSERAMSPRLRSWMQADSGAPFRGLRMVKPGSEQWPYLSWATHHRFDPDDLRAITEFTFDLYPAKPNADIKSRLVLQYFFARPHAKLLGLRALWKNFETGAFPKARHIRENVIEVMSEVGGPNDAEYRYVLLVWHLGHGFVI